MTKKLKIAVSGISSTGKTTLLNAMLEDETFKGFKLFSNVVRTLKDKGYKINEHGNAETQKAVMYSHKKNVDEPFGQSLGHLYDRCALDGLAYSHFLYKTNALRTEDWKKCKEYFNESIKEYDLIFYLKPEFELVNDGVRPTDKKFNEGVLDSFEYVKGIFNVPTVTLTGSVEERLEQVLKAIKGL